MGSLRQTPAVIVIAIGISVGGVETVRNNSVRCSIIPCTAAKTGTAFLRRRTIGKTLPHGRIHAASRIIPDPDPTDQMVPAPGLPPVDHPAPGILEHQDSGFRQISSIRRSFCRFQEQSGKNNRSA